MGCVRLACILFFKGMCNLGSPTWGRTGWLTSLR